MIELIPRAHLFGNPLRTAYRISRDGTRLAWLAPVEGVLNLRVGPAGDPASGAPVTADRHRGIRDYEWAYDGRHLLYLQDTDGDENHRPAGLRGRPRALAGPPSPTGSGCRC
ncbi:hypothetical protein [Methylobacterium sp. WL6]|uniref:hypothetical protein n=1 Tax=Methylobacterium sp. WL6 TaxID=2603901 RepID=UPI0011C82149|nr:hypothetical protein [Methylobacterium sp. WL6]TXN60826.1 hypothetical protein FV230_25230 [Methylobacterium sp. WL6]